MPAEPGPRRVVLVLARHGAGPAAPPGVDPAALAAAALADTYEVVADLVGVRSGVAGDDVPADLLWPGAVQQPDRSLAALAADLAGEADELVVVPGDAPDLPGLVLAKVFKVLHRSDVVLAPERGGPGVVALGVRLPLAAWLVPPGPDLGGLDPDAAPAPGDLDLDDPDLRARLVAAAPRRAAVQTAPDWHRLRTPASLARLDAGLEGWEETRELLRLADALPGRR